MWKYGTIDQVIARKKELMGRLYEIQISMQPRNYCCGLWKLEDKIQKEISSMLRKQ